MTRPIVVVYADGQVGLRDIPPEWGDSFRDYVGQPVACSLKDASLDPSRIPDVKYREYHKHDYTFDGRPIYCEAPYVTKRASIDWEYMQRSNREASDDAQHQMSRFIKAHDAIEIGSEVTVKNHPTEDASMIGRKRMEAIMAVPK